MKRFLLLAFLCIISFNIMIFGKLLEHVDYLGPGILIFYIGLFLAIVIFIYAIIYWLKWKE